jgi:hypothetical protein
MLQNKLQNTNVKIVYKGNERACFSQNYKPKSFIEWIPDQLMEFVSHANIHY